MKTEKKRTLKGSILFTVVSVMALMIIFMTSTLALASAANKRAHKSYASSQTNYTARAAIDSILAAAGTDSAFADALDALGPGSGFDVIVDINDPSLGRVESARVDYAGTKSVFDPATRKWVEKNLIAITAEVTLGGETSTITSHILQDPVKSGADSPGFLTMGDASVDTHTSSFGGTYLGMGTNWMYKSYIEADPAGNIISTLNDKNYLTYKEFTMQNDNTSEAPIVIDGSLKLVNTLEVFYQQKDKGVQIWGNLDLGNDKLRLKSTLLGSNQSFQFNEMPYLYVDGAIIAKNSARLGSVYNGNQLQHNRNNWMPLNIFCGSLQLTGGQSWIAADVYCYDTESKDYVEYTSNGITGEKVVAMGEPVAGETKRVNISNNTTHITNDATKLYNWAASISVGGNSYTGVGGNFYSKGNLVIGGNSNSLGDGTPHSGKVFEGDVRVEGDVTINSRTTINGSLAVGGTLTINTPDLEVGNGIYADTFAGTHIEVNGNAPLKNGYTKNDLYFVMAKDITCTGVGDQLETVPYAWLKPEVYDYEDVDGNRIGSAQIEGTDVHDFVGALIPSEFIDEKLDITEDEAKELAAAKKFYKEQYLDPSGNEVAKNEAVLPAGAYYRGHHGRNIQIQSTTTFKNLNDGKIFPAYAEKDVILGLVQVDDGNGGFLPQAQTQVMKTVYQVMNEWDLEGMAIIRNPNPATPENSYTGSTTKLEINDHAKLSGKWDATSYPYSENGHRDIVIVPPENDAIWVELNNFQTDNGVRIVIDDTQSNGVVNFFVTGQNNKMGSGSCIVTKSFLDLINSNSSFQVLSDPEDPTLVVPGVDILKPPGVNMYSEIGASFEGADGFYLTAYVQAPYMNFKCPTFGLNSPGLDRIYYDGIKLSTCENRDNISRLGVVGCMDVRTGAYQNNWILLYVNPNSGGNTFPDANNEHTYASVDYFGY